TSVFYDDGQRIDPAVQTRNAPRSGARRHTGLGHRPESRAGCWNMLRTFRQSVSASFFLLP
ncbi:MAG: hypothetical protein ACW96N_07605, partial [Candidatus Thorarchaeota archaeon]